MGLAVLVTGVVFSPATTWAWPTSAIPRLLALAADAGGRPLARARSFRALIGVFWIALVWLKPRLFGVDLSVCAPTGR